MVQILIIGYTRAGTQSLVRTVSCREGASEAARTRAALREERGESGTTLVFAARTVTQMSV